MNKAELKARWEKLPDRTKMLLDKYPLVAAAVFLLGFAAGGLAGLVFW